MVHASLGAKKPDIQLFPMLLLEICFLGLSSGDEKEVKLELLGGAKLTSQAFLTPAIKCTFK
jgi:hypothetical protein